MRGGETNEQWTTYLAISRSGKCTANTYTSNNMILNVTDVHTLVTSLYYIGIGRREKNSRARDGDEFHEIHRHKMIECKATLPVMWEYWCCLVHFTCSR